MIYNITTNTDLETIKSEIAAKAKEVGFGILKEYAFKDILEGKGFPIEHDITVYLGDRATEIDTENQRVLSEKGITINYDKVVLATGSYPQYRFQ
jgi:NADPH-dependent 2,4-dienoyl-CoA reductase/sulfur reductase-like enzyme